MTGVEEDDPLAELQPRLRTGLKKARLVQLARSILNARLRGVSLEDITKGIANLPKNPVTVSPDYLNNVMAEHHGADWPKGKPRKCKSAASIRKSKSTVNAKANATARPMSSKATATDEFTNQTAASKKVGSGSSEVSAPDKAQSSEWLTAEDMKNL